MEDPARRHRLVAAIPSILVLAAFIDHALYLHPVLEVSKWKGGGMGVYCTTYEKRMVTWVRIGGRSFLVKSTLHPHYKIYTSWHTFVPYETDELLRDYARQQLAHEYLPIEAPAGDPLPRRALRREELDPGADPTQATRADAVLVQIWRYEYRSPTEGQWRLAKTIEESPRG
ncbi:MAG: hypothetical protein H6712_10720 [Myxococcales bacterium]|nr:hypothetical protein [Myxococcales bacterium]MCB9714322.1 hypothetical protein [Myxococcales bacterium]